MSKMIDDLLAQGIKINGYAVGSYKTTCPRCSHTRKKKSDPCLWVNVKEGDLALWKCHNCEWTGSAGNAQNAQTQQERKREYTQPATPPAAAKMSDPIIEFFRKRGIIGDVVKRNKVYAHANKAGVICFPYYVDGKLTNVKYRSVDKKFYMEKGAKLTFYGVDDVKNADEIIIVEGEMDKLALEMGGLTNVISVPNGAPAKKGAPDRIDNTGQFEYLMHAEETLKRAKKVIIAVDNDQAGKNLQWELARRIGHEKCWVVEWPQKDANDCLIELGIDVTLSCIHDATPMPINGLYQVNDFKHSLANYFNSSMERGALTGWENVDSLYTVMPGELCVVTGVPNSGKSEWIDALMVNLAKNDNWSFTIFSPENSKEQHVTKLAEKIIEKPTDPKAQGRMSYDEYMSGCNWVSDYFYFIVADDEKELPTIDWILDKARAAVYRYGIKGLVIDPYNEIEHRRPQGINETEYVSEMLSKVKRFAKNNGVAVWMVAHPAKMMTDKDGKIRVPSLYDISGSANWVNKADCGVVVHRSEDAADTTEIHVKKVRFKHVGRRGQCNLLYDKKTGKYRTPYSQKKQSSYGHQDEDMITFQA